MGKGEEALRTQAPFGLRWLLDERHRGQARKAAEALKRLGGG